MLKLTIFGRDGIVWAVGLQVAGKYIVVSLAMPITSWK